MESTTTISQKIQIEPEWSSELNGEFQKDYFKKLKQFLIEEKKSNVVYPASKNIFAAFNHTPFRK